MRSILTILFAIYACLFANAQKNYPVFSIEECGAVCLIDNEPVMCAIEDLGGLPKLVLRNLEDGKENISYKSRLPENPVSNIVFSQKTGLLYLFTIRKQPETGNSLFDAIYSFSPKQDKLELIYKENEEKQDVKSVEVVDNLLVFTTKMFQQPDIFNTETKKFEGFVDDENIRMLCAAPSHNGFVVVNISELDGDEAAVYFMDLERKLTPKLGTFNSSMRISTNEEENSLPGFNLTNDEYNWMVDEYNTSGFPLSGFSIATRANLAKTYNQLANFHEISSILDANDDFLIAKAKGVVSVYNIKTPVTKKPQTVSDEDLKAIQEYYDSRTTYEEQMITSTVLPQVFTGKFYNITETIKFDEYSYLQSSFVVCSANDGYKVLKEKEELMQAVNPGFILNSDVQAVMFQDAINAIYPPGTFEKDKIKFYKKESNWIFVRDESFGEEEGFVVKTNEKGKITEILYKSEI